jgi:aminopeptidase N
MKRIFALALLSLGTCVYVRAQRLPDTVVPESYDLTFTPDLAKATFTGDETIRVQVRKATSAVTLNSAE